MRTQGDHYQVSENAFNNLAAWQQAEWAAVRDGFLGPYSGYVDNLSPAFGDRRAAIEPRYKELMYVGGEYCQVALDSASRERHPFVRYSGHMSGEHVIERHGFLKVYGHYFKEMVKALRRRDHETAAKCAGIVSHLMCDHNPGDHMDVGTWLGVNYPPPPEVAPRLSDCWAVTTQEVQVPLIRYAPRLLGQTVPEAIHVLHQRYLAMMKRAIPYVSRMLGAVYQGQPAEAQRLLGEARLLGIEVLSDFLYTAFCIAYRRFDPEQKQALQSVDLAEWFPVVNEMDYLYFYGPYTDCVVDFFHPQPDGRRQAQRVKAELLVSSGGGAPVVQPIDRCLAVLPDSGNQLVARWAKLVYELPRGCFRRFTCVAGMPPGLSVNARSGHQGRVEVKVFGDGAVLFERPLMCGGEPAVALDLDITRCKHLTLQVTGQHRSFDEFWLGHFIWGRPTLHK
jgi:hypothetical protein